MQISLIHQLTSNKKYEGCNKTMTPVKYFEDIHLGQKNKKKYAINKKAI